MKITEDKLKDLMKSNPYNWSHLLINALEEDTPNSAAIWYLNIVDNIISLRNIDNEHVRKWKIYLDEIKSVINGTKFLSIEELFERSKLVFHEFKDKNRISFFLSHAYAFQINYFNNEFDKYKKNMTLSANRFAKEGDVIIPIIKKYYDLQMEN